MILCTGEYCDPSILLLCLIYVDNSDFCPNNHSPSGQCCSNYETDMCGWNSQIGEYNGKYYAEGTIVRDEFSFSENSFSAYFVDVLLDLGVFAYFQQFYF